MEHQWSYLQLQESRKRKSKTRWKNEKENDEIKEVNKIEKFSKREFEGEFGTVKRIKCVEKQGKNTIHIRN